MKQEDKAEAYDKVRKKIAIRFGSNVADEFFAEFEESEDEKVRKEIVNYFQCQSEEEPTRKEIHNKWIAWLENIPYTIDHEKREGFHLGYKACLERQVEQNFAENAKPQSSTPMSYGKELEKRMCEACNRFYAPNTDSNRYSASDLFYAGVKAERDLNTLAWSEEDEYRLNSCLNILQPKTFVGNTETINTKWLKSFKGRVQPKQEWSDVDKDILFRTINDLKFLRDTISIDPKYAVNIIDMEREITWLKSLRPQNTWKPSDEQIKVCKEVYADLLSAKGFDLGTVVSELNRLEEGLKKKGE